MTVAASTFNALDYLNQVKGITPAAATAPVQNADTSSDSDTSGSGATATTSSTPSTNTLGIPTDVLSLLQGVDSSSSTGGLLSTLLGGSSDGVSSSDPLAGVYNALLSADTQTSPLAGAISNAQVQQTDAAAESNPVSSLITSYNSAINAYNQTAQQNALAAIQAQYQAAGGQLPLVA